MPKNVKKPVSKKVAAKKLSAKTNSRARPSADSPNAPRTKASNTHTRAAATKRNAARTTGMPPTTESYRHDEKAAQRPDVGVQHRFSAKKPPKTYRYDSSLDPALAWDENAARDVGDWLIGLIERTATDGESAVFAEPQAWKGGTYVVESLKAAAALLRSLSRPYLDWAGKAERHQITVPTVPLFVHERHSTKAILDGIKHRVAKGTTLDLFGDAGMDVTDQLSAYEHQGPWANRMILGDSLQVMNSLLEYEGLGGQVQMVYMDPPYGVKFGSNFQPFVRKREVKHGGDDDMTREPEMVKAYRDTWELGLHSYLTYIRDRLRFAKDLLHYSGSVFIQIGAENRHHVRELLDEVFGAENFLSEITFVKTSGSTGDFVPTTVDYLLMYARDITRVKYRQLYQRKEFGGKGASGYNRVRLSDGSTRSLTPEERTGQPLPVGSQLYCLDNITSQSMGRDKGEGAACWFPVEIGGKKYLPPQTARWKTNELGMAGLKKAGRLEGAGNRLGYVRYWSDFPYFPITDLWDDVMPSFMADKLYVVQTSTSVIERCMLMASDPGDLVLDPTCGSGTTAFVAEQWGRRWITCDTSRVPLALARQRLLTATFPYYDLKDQKRGPQGGFVYSRKQNQKGEEVGGLVPHITLKNIANDEAPKTEVLVDRPEVIRNITRVAGPFVVEATLPAAMELDADLDATVVKDSGNMGATATRLVTGDSDFSTHVDRMLAMLRQSKTLRLPGNRELKMDAIRAITDGEWLHAEAVEQNGTAKRIAIVFGPESGAVTSNLAFEATSEAKHRRYEALYVFGFAVDPKAHEFLHDTKRAGLPATYVAVTPDVAMDDLLKTNRSSEIFSVTGLPDVDVRKSKTRADSKAATLWEVEVRGLDVFNPGDMTTGHTDGEHLPCWMLDTDYNGMSFYAAQVFFPKTQAWDNLKRSLGASLDDSVWDHLAGTVSEPFAPGEHKRIAVKVIDERGNELMVVKDLGV